MDTVKPNICILEIPTRTYFILMNSGSIEVMKGELSSFN